MTETPDPQLQLKKRARRRLVGAVAFAGLAAVILPMVMDDEPRQPPQEVQIRIPGQDQVPPFTPQALAAKGAPAAVAPASGEEQQKASTGTSQPAVPPPVTKGSAETSEKTGTKTAEKKVAKPAEKQVEKQAEKKASKATEVTPEKKAVKPPEKPVEKAVEKKAAPPAASPQADKATDKKVAKAAEKPVEKKVEKSREKTPDKTAEKAPARKVEKPAENSAAEASAEDSGKSSADDTPHASSAAAGKQAEGAASKPGGQQVILIGTFANPDNAKQLQSKIGGAGVNSYTEVLDTSEGKKIRVRAGPFATREAADKALEKLKKAGVTGVVAGRQ